MFNKMSTRLFSSEELRDPVDHARGNMLVHLTQLQTHLAAMTLCNTSCWLNCCYTTKTTNTRTTFQADAFMPEQAPRSAPNLVF
jgi:hypothetical protein